MENPFEVISKRLSNIESLLLDIKAAPKTEADKPDRIFLDDVIELTGLSAPAIYKESSQHKLGMPCSRFGNRLVFSRKEITAWMKENTIRKRSVDDQAAQDLQAVAKRKTAS